MGGTQTRCGRIVGRVLDQTVRHCARRTIVGRYMTSVCCRCGCMSSCLCVRDTRTKHKLWIDGRTHTKQGRVTHTRRRTTLVEIVHCCAYQTSPKTTHSAFGTLLFRHNRTQTKYAVPSSAHYFSHLFGALVFVCRLVCILNRRTRVAQQEPEKRTPRNFSSPRLEQIQ